jgi:hypothetical protein
MTEATARPLRPEWSHRVEVDNLGARPLTLSVTAGAQERKDLARRLQVQAVEELKAAITVTREPGSLSIHVEGRVTGRVVQGCVVTQHPVAEDISEEFESWYADPKQAVPFARARRERLARGEREMEVLPERDDPEEVTDGFIDVAELATQYLCLGLNPYPHAGDMPPVGMEEVEAAAPGRRNPFAALKDWKRQKDGT